MQVCFDTTVHESITPSQMTQMMELEFVERNSKEESFSQEDSKFLKILKEGIHQLDDGHYEMPLPFKSSSPYLENNKSLAIHCLRQLKRKLKSDSLYANDYNALMQDIIPKGNDERVPVSELFPSDGAVYYIPHHGVYHPQKTGKIRVVFDCSAKSKGTSLNDNLLQGPNLTNTLIGVLCRFRQDSIAFIGDIEAMFYQFRVYPDQRDFLSSLWWEDGDVSSEPKEYCMNVHLFGAALSPGCANYGLKQIASDYANEFGYDAAQYVHRNFYGLKSVSTEIEAIDLISRELFRKGMFVFTSLFRIPV